LQLLYSDEESYYKEAEPVEQRKSRWYPSVGKARSPAISKARKTLDTVNRKYHPRSKSSSRNTLVTSSQHHKKRPRSLVMQRMEDDTRANTAVVEGPRYRREEREMEREQKQIVEDRLELEEQRRRFMMGKGQEAERMAGLGPVSIDPFADEELYKPTSSLGKGVKIKYKYT
jgi:hypothetical protein